jgi:hypothetical protein
MVPSAGIQKPGGLLELFACSDVAPNHPDLPASIFYNEDEIIEIEGDSEYLISLLKAWLSAAERVTEFAEQQKATAEKSA